jgi:hypothetical protein
MRRVIKSMAADTHTYAIVPGTATATTADVWIGAMALNAPPSIPPAAALRTDAATIDLPAATWQRWLVPDASAGVAFTRATVGNLKPRARQRVELIVDGASKAVASIATLPDRLPGLEERPFTLMLGSCFCAAEDKSGRTGKAFASLTAALKPDLKLLAGDQVYLDSPFLRFLTPHTRQGLAELFLKNYVATWTQSGDRQGFQAVLSDGPMLMTSDDHEFWNNAPFASFSINTWTEGGRRAWMELARGLLSAFQMFDGNAVRRVDVGELQMLVVDTRINRDDERKTFLRPADLQQIVSWIEGLTFPGLLVVGQPIFAPKAGIAGNIADWNLPDFDQYAPLCRALLAAPQPVIILTGDVHYGRVARVITHAGVEIAEIISSPMSLVTGGGARTFHDPPGEFPADAIPGVANRPIECVSTWKRAADHFLLLELWREGNRLRVRAQTRETVPDDQTPSHPVYDHSFQKVL